MKRRIEDQPVCPDCERVMARLDFIRSACRHCGRIVVDIHGVLLAFGRGSYFVV